MKISCLNWLICVTLLLKKCSSLPALQLEVSPKRKPFQKRYSFSLLFFIFSLLFFFLLFFPLFHFLFLVFSLFFLFLLQFSINHVASGRWPKVASRIIGSKSVSFSHTSVWGHAGSGDRISEREGKFSADSLWWEVRLHSLGVTATNSLGVFAYATNMKS